MAIADGQPWMVLPRGFPIRRTVGIPPSEQGGVRQNSSALLPVVLRHLRLEFDDQFLPAPERLDEPPGKGCCGAI